MPADDDGDSEPAAGALDRGGAAGWGGERAWSRVSLADENTSGNISDDRLVDNISVDELRSYSSLLQDVLTDITASELGFHPTEWCWSVHDWMVDKLREFQEENGYV